MRQEPSDGKDERRLFPNLGISALICQATQW
jgi:hypothetical protein